jgi:hypothetical protein
VGSQAADTIKFYFRKTARTFERFAIALAAAFLDCRARASVA